MLDKGFIVGLGGKDSSKLMKNHWIVTVVRYYNLVVVNTALYRPSGRAHDQCMQSSLSSVLCYQDL